MRQEPRYLKIEFAFSVLILMVPVDTTLTDFPDHRAPENGKGDDLSRWMDALFALIYLRSESGLDPDALAGLKSQYIKVADSNSRICNY